MKSKYDVIKMIRTNVLKGLEAFGETGWECMEADQQSYRNIDKVVLLSQRKSVRVGWQMPQIVSVDGKICRKNSWIDQQSWEIRILLKRTTAAVTGSTVTVIDVAEMLAAWFNDEGCAEFRKSGCGNLLVSQRDIRTYNDNSNVSQYVSSLTLELQVPKSMIVEIPDAGVQCEGVVAI